MWSRFLLGSLVACLAFAGTTVAQAQSPQPGDATKQPDVLPDGDNLPDQPPPAPTAHRPPTSHFSASPPVLTLSPRAARTAPVVPNDPLEPGRTEWQWYGWQPLLTDLAVIAFATGDQPVLAGGAYLLGGPVVHWANGNVGRGFASLSLRVGLPLVVGLTAVSACESSRADHRDESDENNCGLALLYGVFGMVGAVAIDAAALSWHKKPVEQPVGLEVGPVRLTPTVAVSKHSGALGLEGTF